VSTPPGVVTTSEEATTPSRDPIVRITARFLLAVVIGAGVALLAWALVPTHLSGRFDVVGYPLYADFDVNRYFDAFYLIAIAFPLVALAAYVLAARFGPLRRQVPRRRADGAAIEDTYVDEPTTTLGRWGRVAVVGAVLGMIVGAGGSSDALTVTVEVAVGWVAFVGIVAAGARRWSAAPFGRVIGVVNAIGVFALLPLWARAAARAGVTVTSTGVTDHYPLFPIQVALVALAVGVAFFARAYRRGSGDRSDLDRPLVRYVAVPLAIYVGLAFVPGDLGPMDAFGEGEYLGAGARILNGALPWRDLWLIHGLLDDGLKSLVGFGIFGFSRWGATAGITAVLTPAYFVTSYLFAAYFLRARWALVASAAIAFGCSIFVDWDVRYLLLPLVLITLTAALRRRTLLRGGVLGFALVAQSVLVPELTLALPPFALCVLLAEWVAHRRAWREFRATEGTVLGIAGTGIAFGIYLVVTHSLSGFVGYYRDFGDAHSLTGGIPLFTNYARYGYADGFGVLRFYTTPTGWTTRYALELVLPLVAVLFAMWLTTARIRGGRGLSSEDFVMLGMTGLVLLYFQKSISRADYAHIGEVFAVSSPLVVILVGRAAASADRAARRFVEGLAAVSRVTNVAVRSSVLWTSRRSLGSLATLAVAVGLAPVGVTTIVRAVPGHLLTSSPTAPAPGFVAGGPTLGFASPNALPTRRVENLERVFDAEAGTHGAIFDFSDAPGIVDFLLERNPASRFYDISLALTESSQRLVVDDLAQTRPRLVLFTGISGLPAWDYIANDVRQYIVSTYILNHYRPLVLISGEMIYLRDDIRAAPLPKLFGRPITTVLDYRQGVCAFGNIPNFLDVPAVPTTAVTVPLTPIASRGGGRVYRLVLPSDRHSFEWLALTRSATGPGGLTIGSIRQASGKDVPWYDITWVASGASPSVVSVGSCPEWHGYGHEIYIRYKGPGTLTSVRLFNS
jgi:hypothetical protein